MTIEEINNKLTIPVEDVVSSIKINEAEYIYKFLSERNITKTLEIGFAYARSSSHIILATKSKHIVIDPFQVNYQNLGVKNIENLGFGDLLEYRNDYSHSVLPQLFLEKRKFDFIFIDGDHKFDGIFVDFYYADMLIENNGYIMLHDTWMRSTRLIMKFISRNRKDYQYIKTPLRNLALYQKIANDQRDGMHFNEFYTLKSLFVHKIIIWLSNGKTNLFKKLIFKLKEKIK